MIHLEILVEEPSMEQFLLRVLPKVLREDATMAIHPHQGKDDLLTKLENRLRGYARWITEDYRVVVLVDRDQDDCRELKERLESCARRAGLRTRSMGGGSPWQVVNRIAVRELESWYFGDWQAVTAAFPDVSRTVSARPRYRDPDAIPEKASKALERLLKRNGYFRGGLAKGAAAKAVGVHLDPDRNSSHSFRVFKDAIVEAAG